jgi:DNA-binding FadR family transcriptional regulator
MVYPTAAQTAVFEPVLAPTTFEETVERLGTAIRLGLLTPGERLPSERELAEQLGIARSTLRQAITTLVQSGHLHSQRGRGGGTFVVQRPPLAQAGAGPLPEDWRDVLDLRAALECGVVTLAAQRADRAALARLDALVAEMEEATDFAVYRRADVRLHIGIAEAAGAPRLVAALTDAQREVSELIAHIAHPPAVLRHGDGAAALRVLRRHLEGTEHILAGLQA